MGMDIPLFGLAVVDDHNRIHTVGFAFISNSTAALIEMWLVALKQRHLGWRPSMFGIGGESAERAAIEGAWGKDRMAIQLCFWHLKRCWDGKFSKFDGSFKAWVTSERASGRTVTLTARGAWRALQDDLHRLMQDPKYFYGCHKKKLAEAKMDIRALLQRHHCDKFYDYFVSHYNDAQQFAPNRWIWGLVRSRASGRQSTQVIEFVFRVLKKFRQSCGRSPSSFRLDDAFRQLFRFCHQQEIEAITAPSKNNYRGDLVAKLVTYAEKIELSRVSRISARRSACCYAVAKTNANPNPEHATYHVNLLRLDQVGGFTCSSYVNRHICHHIVLCIKLELDARWTDLVR
ncbi:hypothetical protein H632_c199p0 [Helicosporidium sp. ATCC 50920]|nr:hypothetical protein H632_c199p0 [Helicosporidium sp. ATCC 50920]|eukprot:KDD76512.1 hypothetical protein H632_c199p0 [Helicosporidium sp. ATCC 50920]